MSSQKALLKAIGASIQAKKYDEAVEQAEKVVAADPKSYQGNVFLGFALEKLNKLNNAEKAYIAATKIKESDPQAWQGLIKLYEKQGSNKIDEYRVATLRLAQIYENQDDRFRCQSVVDTFLEFVKSQGTRLQHRQSLELVLPTSPIYDFLEGRVPHPSHTYQIIAQITEFEEKERTNKEIGERRTRLGAKIGQVTTEVKREVLRDSDLEEIYSHIINWSNDDAIRRQYEERLVQRCMDHLTVLPPGKEKNEKRVKLEKLAGDMVLIKHPYKLAWDIAIEWKDAECIEELDVNILREYYMFFPTSGLAKVLRGFMTSEISPFPPSVSENTPNEEAGFDESDEDDEEGGVQLDAPMLAEDRLLLMVEGMSEAGSSILAHRLMGEYYQFLEEHESIVELMRNGLRLIQSESSKIGIGFPNSSESVTTLLATALVFYQSPRNHPEAKTLFESILKDKPNSTPALIGIGLIYEEEEDYPAAIDFLNRALSRDSNNIRVKAEAAWVRALNGDYAKSKEDLEVCLVTMQDKKLGPDIHSRDLLAQTQYRIGVCLWNIDSSKAARKDRKGAYAYFLASLKSNLNFAPSYTSLGIYYADYAKDKKRARKCFQKAFELSASEIEAAERLAKAFSETGDWELVEVVAQRVVDSGKIRAAPGSKKKSISWPYAALGIAELNKQEYAKSIVSFQSALRLSPNDYHSWVGLGESYHNSGRYMAATKAFQHAEKFEAEVEQQHSGETWFAKYMLANVKRELGEYDQAIEGYKAVLQTRKGEFGVSVALIQTLVESAWDSVDKGLLGQAVEHAAQTIDFVKELLYNNTDTFNLWRAVGDACSIFSWVQSRIGEFPHKDVSDLLQSGETTGAYKLFLDIDGVGMDIVAATGIYSENEKDGVDLVRCLHASILSHKRAIEACTNDPHAQAVAYYNLGWAENRAHACLASALKKRSTRYLKSAVRCFKRAIELEAGNPEFWNALGVVTSELNPRVAQHSFVRSLFLNERSSQVWTNLGGLCLLQNDMQLANEAFTRAQSADPDYAHAWVGQGLLALLLGDPKEANLLFTHAMEISDSSSLITKRQYGQSTFDRILGAASTLSVVDLVQPIFALNQLHSIIPKDLSYYHLSALFLERVNDISTTLSTLSSICKSVEADYEVTESASSLSRFALAKADLARSQLAARNYQAAIDSGETALQLSAEDTGNELTAEVRQKCRLSAHLTVGVAYYYCQDAKTALDYFLPALEESNGSPDAVCLLAQVLWAEGSEDSRAKARDYLFDCVEKAPGHVQSVLLLGVIALLDSDAESLDAVATELQSLRSSDRTTDEERTQVGEVLRAIAEFGEESSEQLVLTEIQTEIFLHPALPAGWSRLGGMSNDLLYPAEMALGTAARSVPPKGQLEAADLALAFSGTGKLGHAQQAIMVAPWVKDGWEALSEGVSG
ncbi:hypothetical protein F5884DRAFT_815815 [Xylogone sp. PMI_703]|nr:hypothetical protein F5884DRAFT_815815 [Xylogone sp. PMI_703]